MNGKTAKLINKVTKKLVPSELGPSIRSRAAKQLKQDWYQANCKERRAMRRALIRLSLRGGEGT